jgi:hypothetical protein
MIASEEVPRDPVKEKSNADGTKEYSLNQQ